MSNPRYRRRKTRVDHPWRECPSRKVTYRSEAEALVAAILRPDHPWENETRPYRCPRCGLWHLTSKHP